MLYIGRLPNFWDYIILLNTMYVFVKTMTQRRSQRTHHCSLLFAFRYLLQCTCLYIKPVFHLQDSPRESAY